VDLYFHLLLPSLIAEHTQHMLGHLNLVEQQVDQNSVVTRHDMA
jgi:hypothetical protein